MSRRDWWFGVLLLSVILCFHTAFPRYEIRLAATDQNPFFTVRCDRWTGRIEISIIPETTEWSKIGALSDEEHTALKNMVTAMFGHVAMK